jgi:lipopolysaccharide transport system ATP-binding protein
MAIIEVNHVTKEFRLGQLHSLKQSALDAMARLRGHPVPARAPFKALDDVDFKIEPGEVLGIIGHNGAGKSTLLKLLARISSPTRGTLKVQGSVAPLIEVGAGLVPDLTGRENIYLNGVILGMRRDEIRQKFDDIVAFAELEEFIDTPIKRYSSGMQVRLGFSVATCVTADVLIVDEVLSVGDLAFQRKCFDRMEDMIRRQGKTVLLVSHNIRQVERICNRVILLERGKILMDGDAREVCNSYYERNEAKIRSQPHVLQVKTATAKRLSSGEVVLVKAAILDRTGEPTDRIKSGSDVTLSLLYEARAPLINPIFGVGIHTQDFLYLATKDSDDSLKVPRIGPGVFRVECRIARFPLLAGVYSLRLGVGIGEFTRTAFYAENVLQFQVEPAAATREQTMRDGFVALETGWQIHENVAETVQAPD